MCPGQMLGPKPGPSWPDEALGSVAMLCLGWTDMRIRVNLAGGKEGLRNLYCNSFWKQNAPVAHVIMYVALSMVLSYISGLIPP